MSTKQQLVPRTGNKIAKGKRGPEIDPSAEMLISRAIDANVPVATMERLIAMRTQLKAEKARELFRDAMVAFQTDCPIIKKNKKVKVDTSNGGSHTYTYAPLDAIIKQIRPLIKKLGLSFTFQTRFEANPPSQVAICTVHHVAGHSESSEFRCPVDATARMNQMQQSASSQTYGKRYALCNAFGIVTGEDDDDGGRMNQQQAEQKDELALLRAQNTAADFVISFGDAENMPQLAELFDKAQDALRKFKSSIPLDDYKKLFKRIEQAKDKRKNQLPK